MPRDLVIFDFDGTLADTWLDIATGLNRTLREAGLPEAAGADVHDWVGHGVRRLIGRAIDSDDAARIEPLYLRFRAHYADCCLDTTVVYDGVRAALDAIAPRHTLAILSNKPQTFLDRIADGLGISPLFATIVGGDALAVSKPDPATIGHVVRSVGGAGRWDGRRQPDRRRDRPPLRRPHRRCAWGLRERDELRRRRPTFIERAGELPALLA
jgi:phosphoglycolate phosphatase